jgi:diaminopimelate decarboxylase
MYPNFMQGANLLELAEQFGTPLYVYDAAKMALQVQNLKNAFSGVKLKLKYACKALTNLSVLKFLREQGMELDAVSIEEVKIGLAAGFLPEEILFTPNCVSFAEIEEAVGLGVLINIDNIAVLEEFGHRYGHSVPCCIRLNPHIMAGGNSKIQVGHIDSKFGISILQMRHVLRVVSGNNIHVVGLHMHTGSDILDSGVFLQAAELLFEQASNFAELMFVDFGSGFKVAYKKDDIVTDIEGIGQELTQRFQSFCAGYGRELELWFEPGKYIVSEAGVLLVKANVIKQTPAACFVGVDSGLNHLIRPMLYGAYHEISNLSNPAGISRLYNIVGYICETDTFGYDRKLSEVKQGDVLCLYNAGAYGFSMSSNYNSRLRPAEVLWVEGQAKLVRRRESLEDLLSTQMDFASEKSEKRVFDFKLSS